MKYVVINVIEREILKVGIADTSAEATEILKADFMNEFFNNGYTEEDLEDDCSGNWELNETEAWLNGNSNYDWRIIEVE